VKNLVSRALLKIGLVKEQVTKLCWNPSKVIVVVKFQHKWKLILFLH